MRLIDADAVILNYGGLVYISPYDFQGIAKYFAEQIAAAPTIDAVPVVRCRECIHWVGDFPGATKYVKRCEWAGYMVGENGYCVYGERKEGEQDNE